MTQPTYVISLDPQSSRFKAFANANKHLNYSIFVGIRGASVPPQERVSKGLLTRDCARSGLVTDGRLGAALSHWSLWQEAIKINSGILILEDDVITHPQLSDHVATRVPQLPNPDIVLFGLNTDSVVDARSPQGLRQARLFYEQYLSCQQIQYALDRTTSESVSYWKLFRGFGLYCYFITPDGAKRLSSSLFPLRLDAISVPFVPRKIAQVGADRRLNALYETINAYVSIPFLAYTPNTDSSTNL
jgi:GR25 family glycosyltransferase involved in LPS biosynthesis